MFCPKCGKKLKDGWRFCPYCGARLEPTQNERVFHPFKGIFNRFFEEFEEVDKLLSKDFEVFDITPWFERPRASGFSITITQSGNKKPQVRIKTFGNIDKERIREAVEKKFGVKSGKKIVEVEPTTAVERKPIPRITEEPKTEVRRLQNKIIVEMNLPGIESEKDIEVNELSESVEVKAIGDEKAYFKILKIPKGFRIVRKEFKDDKLTLELSL